MRPSFTHLHLLHFNLHPLLINSLHALLASGRVVHNGCQPVVSFFHPQFSGLCKVGLHLVSWSSPHVWPPVHAALKSCCLRAACVGGMLSKAFPCETRWTLTSFTFWSSLVLSYRRTTNPSNLSSQCCGICWGLFVDVVDLVYVQFHVLPGIATLVFTKQKPQV